MLKEGLVHSFIICDLNFLFYNTVVLKINQLFLQVYDDKGFDKGDMSSPKRHVLISLLFILKSLS